MNLPEKFKNQDILITGGLGFLGYNFAKVLGSYNNITVVDKDQYLQAPKRGFSSNIHHLYTVSTADKSFLNTLPQYSIIFHFGSPSSVLMFNENEEECIDESIVGSLNIIKKAKRDGSFLVIPTSGTLSALRQGSPNIYSQTKDVIRLICHHYLPVDQFKALEIFAGFGPGEEVKGKYASIIFQWLRAIKNDEKIEIWGDGNQVRDFVYIDDIITQTLTNSFGDEEILSGFPYSFNQVIEVIKEVTGKEVKVKYVNQPINYTIKVTSERGKDFNPREIGSYLFVKIEKLWQYILTNNF